MAADGKNVYTDVERFTQQMKTKYGVELGMLIAWKTDEIWMCST